MTYWDRFWRWYTRRSYTRAEALREIWKAEVIR